MSAMKTGVQRNENLILRRVKTELPEVETIGTEITNIMVSPEEERAYDELLSILSGPPKVPNTSGLAAELLEAYALSIPTLKNALISFLTTAKPEDDPALMITQVNRALTSLYSLNADCGSFYNKVRSYIDHLARVVSNIEANLEKARECLTPLEAKSEVTKALLNKLEAEPNQQLVVFSAGETLLELMWKRLELSCPLLDSPTDLIIGIIR
ncbi:unnamed protein product [Dovyalis caffra]|uniref:Uncharacterized protein n=1 Tax=Dovyalis caffra TaxID=77055 RepID=A0AAV1S9I1_9ROSI|nr:unnamed protein product [Dovyalis caffra]